MNGSLLLSFGMPFALKLAMRPMSLYESGDSTGEVSLKDLFDGSDRYRLIMSNEYHNGNISHTNSTPLNSEKEYSYIVKARWTLPRFYNQLFFLLLICLYQYG